MTNFRTKLRILKLQNDKFNAGGRVFVLFFYGPLSQLVLITYLVPIGRNQPFKRMPGQKYSNDDTLGRPVLSGKSV